MGKREVLYVVHDVDFNNPTQTDAKHAAISSARKMTTRIVMTPTSWIRRRS